MARPGIFLFDEARRPLASVALLKAHVEGQRIDPKHYFAGGKPRAGRAPLGKQATPALNTKATSGTPVSMSGATAMLSVSYIAWMSAINSTLSWVRLKICVIITAIARRSAQPTRK